jgi:2-dehydro-3-deoxyphosphooctonate aldolase (KDO 8-P synthase)
MKLIAGPCAIEGHAWLSEVAMQLKTELATILFPLEDFYFKASFDKANRTSAKSGRGVGIDEGLDVLTMIREVYDMKTLTDFHEVWQIEKMMVEYPDAVDVIQIPAFLCRQTDLIEAACATGKIVNIKKGQWLSPQEATRVYVKGLECGDANDVWITERGTVHGYGDLIVDVPGIVHIADKGMKVIFDVTHSAQQPGGKTTNGARWKMIPNARAAISTGKLHGLFMEVHPDPKNAISDASTQIPLDHFPDFMRRIGYDQPFMQNVIERSGSRTLLKWS